MYYRSRGVLGVEVTERVPIANIINNQGKIEYCDEYYYIFNYDAFPDASLPIIRDIYNNNNRLNLATLKGAVAIVQTFNQISCDRSIISEITYNNGNYIINMSDFNIQVIIGKVDNIKDKLENVLLF